MLLYVLFVCVRLFVFLTDTTTFCATFWRPGFVGIYLGLRLTIKKGGHYPK